MLKQSLKTSRKPMAQVLMKAVLRSMYLNYQTRKLSLMLKLNNVQTLLAFPPQKLLPKIIYFRRWKKLDDTQQCQQNTHFIRILLDDIINNALCNLGKSSDETKITTRHTNEMSTFVQQSTSDDTLTPTTNDIHAPITKNYYASISASSFDEGFQNQTSKFMS